MQTNDIDKLVDENAAEHSKKLDNAPVGQKDITAQLIKSYKKAIRGIDDAGTGLAVMRLHTRNDLDIKKIRQNIGLTQSKLAQLMDVNLSTVQHWEQGTRQPKSTSKIVLEAISLIAEETQMNKKNQSREVLED